MGSPAQKLPRWRSGDEPGGKRTILHRITGSWLGRLPISDMFGADLRSLALFRMALAWIILIDLVERSAFIREHYSDAGVFPRSTMLSSLSKWRWSLMLMNGTETFQVLILFAALVATIFLLLGYQTRFATIVTWILILSIQNRNTMLLSGGDTLIRVILFWSMFLPLGARWSVDAALARPPRRSQSARFLSLGSAGLFLQIASMYILTAFLKSSTVWTVDGTAIYYALSAGHMARPWTEALLNFPLVLRALTHITLVIEFVAPVLLFFPWRTGPIRTIATAMLISLQIGIFITIDIGVFTWASMFCMFAFLPTWFWNSWAPSILTRFPWLQTAWRNLAAQTQQKIRWGKQEIDSWRGKYPLVRGGEHAEPMSPPAQRNEITPSLGPVPGMPIVGNLIAAICILIVLAWNLATVTDLALPPSVRAAAMSTGLNQSWSMFAPKPPSVTRWHVVQGVLESGQEVNLMHPLVNGDFNQVRFVSWERPDDIVRGVYGNKYWRKYFEAVGKSNRGTERLRMANYICHTWKGIYGGNTVLDRVEIYTLTQKTHLDGRKAEIKKTLIDDFECK